MNVKAELRHRFTKCKRRVSQTEIKPSASGVGIKWVNAHICAKAAHALPATTFETLSWPNCEPCICAPAIPPTRELCGGKRAKFANYSAEFRLFLPRCEVSLRCASEYLGVNSNFRGQTDPE